MRNRRTAFLRVLLALTVLSGCGGSGHSSKPSSSPSGASSLKFAPLNLGLPKEALSAPITGKVPADRTLHVGVTLKISDDTWKQLGHGKSPSQGAQGLAQKLGVSDEELKKLNEYFATAHIQAKPSKTRTSLTFDVKAGVAGQLLKTSFVTHTLRGRSYFTPDPAHMPVVPAQVSGYILSVTGLDSYSQAPTSHHAPMTPLASTAAMRAGACPQFAPHVATNQKIAQSYGYDKLWQQGWHGENMTVNLVEMDGYDPRDIAAYNACTGSHIALSNVNLGATAPPPGGEATLDIEMLAGLAPGVRVVDYQEDPALLSTGSGSDSWTAFNNALQRVIDDNVNAPRPGSAVSISLGGSEGYMSQATMQAVDQNLRILTQAERMTVFVATGDCGAYGDRVYGPLDVSFPSTSQWAVAVGGTRMQFGAAGTRAQEQVWSDRSSLSKCENQWGSGGGVSKVFPKPLYQAGTGVANQYTTGYRQVPDVSAAAIELPVFYRGQWHGFGGTSAATPIWAAGMSLINQGLLTRARVFWYGPDTFYHVFGQGGANTPYYDVVTGNNLYYPATAGYDLSTGLGTPNAANLFNILLNSPA
ncbi:S53 family peptidase [Actinomadura sp. DC4]|uniref:S53 family peptidase n=1 Tax=Actinomadura sp. DC4 TaxID=3055069 RepID=UPI0025B199A8|nr:S53 family peptidase [Actinomadura sp. DC4]MDN3351438.1 S53 family peptidase [Actinomadura sp. DC4]